MQSLKDLKEGKLKGIKKLKLSCGLHEIPEEIFELADTLELLDLSSNAISTLPPDFRRLENLKILFLSDNKFTSVPARLADCKKLEMIGFKANKISEFPEDALPSGIRWLILTNNRISVIPDSIGNCKRLQKVMFAGNMLQDLPEQMQACQNIELLRISANRIKRLPDWLLNLPKLSWLAFAGNPCSEPVNTRNKLTEISWNELTPEEILGEGASGIIYKARWNRINEDVAVKIFKGEVTSDGLPEDEMFACISAGQHPNLVQVSGKLKEHPLQKPGLVFSLIPPGFYNLGLSPSFDTCTRDVFTGKTLLTIQQVVNILTGVASAVLQIHQQGISHGDLYAHNILINEEAFPLFGDFGAGAVYDLNKKYAAERIEKIEVRAFGCLIEDLLTHLLLTDTGSPQIAKLLSELQTDCMNEKVVQRPDFSSVNATLKEINELL